MNVIPIMKQTTIAWNWTHWPPSFSRYYEEAVREHHSPMTWQARFWVHPMNDHWESPYFRKPTETNGNLEKSTLLEKQM